MNETKNSTNQAFITTPTTAVRIYTMTVFTINDRL